MKKYFMPILISILICACTLFSACGGNGGYEIGGKALGLEDGDTLVLQMNLEDSVELTSSDSFTFSKPKPNNTFYDVTIAKAPTGKGCSIANNEGYISGSNVTDIDVMCSPDTYTVGGTVVGLDLGGSLVLQNNKDDDLEVTSDGTFTFATPLADHAYYDVTILTNNSGKTCSVSNNKNIIMGANVTDVIIVCHTDSYNVGGTATGIPAGRELILQNNLQDNLSVTTDGSFTFSTKMPQGGGYHVSILKEPSGTNCTVSNGTGVIGGADITNVSVTCILSPALMMFRSSYSVMSGLMGGVSNADYYCDRDPLCPQLGTCKAMLVDGNQRTACKNSNCSGGTGGQTDWVFQPYRTYVMTDRATEIATSDGNGIFPFPLINTISNYSKYVWTGINADWTTGNTCESWWSRGTSKYGNMGISNAINNTAIYSSDATASTCRYSKGYLYCVEQPD